MTRLESGESEWSVARAELEAKLEGALERATTAETTLAQCKASDEKETGELELVKGEVTQLSEQLESLQLDSKNAMLVTNS